MDNLKIPKLNGDNYTAWSIRTRAALVQMSCWEAIDPGYGAELKEDEKKINEKALTFLFLVVEDNFLDDIADCTRAKDAWISLKDIHTKFGLLHTLQLFREFFNVKMNPGENVSSYLGRLMELHRKLSSCEHGFTDRDVALIMLMGLPKEYEGLILHLEHDEDTLSTKTVKSRLIVEEKKLLRYNAESYQGVNENYERALKAKESGKIRSQETFKKYVRKNERRIRCFSCGHWGHIARKCSSTKIVSPNQKVSSDVYETLFTNTPGNKPVCNWYLDSGATEHMCSQRENFVDMLSKKSKVEEKQMHKAHIAKHEELTHRHFRRFHKKAAKNLVERNGSNDSCKRISKEREFKYKQEERELLKHKILEHQKQEEERLRQEKDRFMKRQEFVEQSKAKLVINEIHEKQREEGRKADSYISGCSRSGIAGEERDEEPTKRRKIEGCNKDRKKKKMKYFSYVSQHGDKMEFDLIQASLEARKCRNLLNQAQYHLAKAMRLNVEENKFFINRNGKFDETDFSFRRSKSENKYTLIGSSNDLTTEIECSEKNLDDSSFEKPIASTEESSEIRRRNRASKPESYFRDPILCKVISNEQTSIQNNDDQITLEEAIKTLHAETWKEAMKEEFNNLYRNQACESIQKPENTKHI